MAAPLLCKLVICVRVRNLHMHCSVLTSVIWFAMLLFHIVMHKLCSVERQLVLTNDLELIRLYDIHTLVLLHWQQNIRFWQRTLVVDFLLVKIGRFFARCYGWGPTSEHQLKIGVFAGMGSLWPQNFWYKGSSPPTILLVGKLGWLIFHKV